MAIISKEERRLAILNAANNLFRTQPVDSVSIDQIVQEAGIAKGTFYLYFHSKYDLLNQLAEAIVGEMARQTAVFVEESELPPMDQLAGAMAILKRLEIQDRFVLDTLERPENIELHDRANIEVVRQIGPILAKIVERGKETGVFDVDDPLSTMQFILAGQAFMLSNERFGWSEEELSERILATLKLVERALGAEPNSLVTKIAIALNKPA